MNEQANHYGRDKALKNRIFILLPAFKFFFLRFLGYANEVGEAFRALVHVRSVMKIRSSLRLYHIGISGEMKN